MVELALPEATVRRGVDFSADPFVQDLCGRDPAPYVLFPGQGARDLAELPGDRPITLIVIDGTWPQAKQLLRRNPDLAALPRVAFSPGAPSAYRIRPQPAEHCVSTVEALARALDVIEGPPGRFEEALLRPLHALVEDQLRCSRQHRAYRRRRPRRRDPQAKPPAPDSVAQLRDTWDRLVCVQGEANAWPVNHPERRDPELVQWRAHRLATGESFMATIRPRQPLGPFTTQHAELKAEALLDGIEWGDFTERWEAFARPDDVLAVWGHFFTSLASSQGLPLPGGRIDVRSAAGKALRTRRGSLEQYAAALELPEDQSAEPGRCARRLRLLRALAHRLCAPEGEA
jgi:hypothetical protein